MQNIPSAHKFKVNHPPQGSMESLPIYRSKVSQCLPCPSWGWFCVAPLSGSFSILLCVFVQKQLRAQQVAAHKRVLMSEQYLGQPFTTSDSSNTMGLDSVV